MNWKQSQLNCIRGNKLLILFLNQASYTHTHTHKIEIEKGKRGISIRYLIDMGFEIGAEESVKRIISTNWTVFVNTLFSILIFFVHSWILLLFLVLLSFCVRFTFFINLSLNIKNHSILNHWTPCAFIYSMRIHLARALTQLELLVDLRVNSSINYFFNYFIINFLNCFPF